jgi:PilZ domain
MFDQRRSQRFPLRLRLKLLTPRVAEGIEGETCNLSSDGVAFTAEITLTPGEPIEYVITLLGDGGSGSAVHLHCMGKFLRKDEISCAATLERYEFLREGLE